MKKWLSGIPAVVLWLGLLCGEAFAIPVSYEVEITDHAIFRLRNTSASSNIEALWFTIGDTSRNFDFARLQTALIDTGVPMTWNRLTPDAVQDKIRSDEIQYTFTGFDPTDRFKFEFNMDEDGMGNTNENVEEVLFNNGDTVPNSMVRVAFAGLVGTLDFTLPDANPAQSAWTYDVSGDLAVIPEPATFLLLSSSLAGMAALRKRRKAR